MSRKSRRKERVSERAVPAPLPQRERAAALLFAVSAALVVLVFAIYAQVRTHGFINYDDPDYVYNNAHVRAGLSWAGVKWAFTTTAASNWHPLTWLSHMADVQIFGVIAGPQLLVNAALHACNAILLLLFLWIATDTLWRSATVAALFAIHPLHVESVAWISERKDTLSGFFFLCCLLAYARYVKKNSRPDYAVAVVALLFGILSKPMVVTTPFVLLLLDFWPFERLQKEVVVRRLVEKIPFLACIVPSIVATLIAQRNAMPTISAIPPLARVANAAIACVKYVGKTLWPSRLSIMYPFPTRIDPRIAILCGALVVAASIAAWLVRKSYPWIFSGWFWFLGMLVPVIGIVQVGIQQMADRYTYLPDIGLFIAIVWSAAYAVERMPQMRFGAAIVGGLAILGLTAAAHAQAGYWSGSVPLFRHALDATSPDNKLAHVNLASGLLDQGQYAEAEREYRLGEGFKPADIVDLGQALSLSAQGKLDAAADAARRAMQENPRNADAAGALGSIELARGDMAGAERALTSSLRLEPNPAVAANLARVRGDMPAARDHLMEAIAQQPDKADLHSGLGAVLARLGDTDGAAREYVTALDLNPSLYDAHMDYGALLSRMGRNDDAAEHFEAAARLRPRSAEPHIYLALLEANQHQFDAAQKNVEQAIAIDHDASNRMLIDAIRIPPRPTVIDEYLAFLRRQGGGH